MPIRVDNNVKNQKTTPALYSDVYANIPAYGQTGRLFFATDTNTIYRDTGSAWVVFIANVVVPSGLSPIGTSGQYIRVNAGATALEYFTFNSTVVTTALGYTPVAGSGTINNIAKFSASGTISNSTITDNGTTVATISKLAIGTAPGTTYQVEIDGGVNIATGHEYRKVGTSIFNTTNNTIPKFTTATNTYTNSNISDNGTSIFLNAQTAVGNATVAGTLFDVNTSQASTNGVVIRSSSVITVGGGTGTTEYFKSIASASATGAYTSIKHFSATQASLGTLVAASQYGLFVDSTMIGGGVNYGVYSDLATSGTTRWNFFANGTAPNFMAGRLNVAMTSSAASVTSSFNVYNGFAVQNNDFAGGSAGTYLRFMLGATSGNTNGQIQVLGSGGTAAANLIMQGAGGNVWIGTTGVPVYRLQLDTDSAAKPSTNTWTIASDSRVKTDIIPYTKGLNEILQINPVEYKYNGKAGFDENTGGIGIIAQDIQPVLPETVNTYFAKLKETDKKDTELLNFNSHALTFVLINAIKELKAEIDLLKQN